jgi:tRNA-binding protein
MERSSPKTLQSPRLASGFAIGNPVWADDHAPHNNRVSRRVATIDDFDKVDIRVGTIVDAKTFPEARKPAFKIWIDFGAEIGIKCSSVQITVHYKLEDLVGRQVMAVVNFPPRRIGPFESQVLTLGVPDDAGAVVLLRPDQPVSNGGRMF